MLACLRMLLLTAYYGASVFLLPFTCDEALSIYNELSSNHLLSTFLYLYLEYRCYPLLLFRDENSFNRLIEIQWTDELLLILHAFANAARVPLSVRHYYCLSTVLAFATVVLVFVLLKLIMVVDVFCFQHGYPPVLELGGGALAAMETIVELALVTWNLLVTITAAHDLII